MTTQATRAVEAARTVAGYHFLVGLEAWSEDPGAMVVHVIDIWPTGLAPRVTTQCLLSFS